MLLFACASFAQQPFGHLTIFSEDGDKFFLVLNGERINEVAQTNLRVEDLTQPHYNAKIIFEDATRAEISKNFLQIADVDGIFMDVTYKIKRDKNNPKKMKLNYYSMTEVDRGFIPSSNVTVMRYGQPMPVAVHPAATVTQTTTTTTSGGIHAGVSVGGVGVSVSVHDPNMQVTHTQTTTTTTSSSSSQGVTYTEATGCANNRCMAQNNFNSALNNIKNQSFDDTRLKVAKQIAQSNCFTASQIAAICKTFSFDESKLDFAKFAYDACTEPSNYFKLNEVFQFSSNVDALTEYIASK